MTDDSSSDNFGDPFDEGPFEESGSLALDLDGTFLIDPEDREAGSLHTVASFSHDFRVSPDSIAATRNKYLRNYRN